jgi:hypothetical protein
MRYLIARDGNIFGPYTTTEVELYLGSGHILPTDLAQIENGEEWLPVEEFFPAVSSAPENPQPGGLPRLFPDPPNLPWWVALILGVVTSLAFFVVWDILESAWLRRVERGSTALWLYIGVAVLYVAKLPSTYHTVLYNLGFEDVPVQSPWSPYLLAASVLLVLIARFHFRRELCIHFNGPEPIGLRLSWLMTLVFGGLYFQYQFNRINDLKRTLRLSVPTA